MPVLVFVMPAFDDSFKINLKRAIVWRLQFDLQGCEYIFKSHCKIVLAKKKSSVLSLRKNMRDSGGRRKYEERARFQERVMGERKSGFRAKRGLFKVQLSFWPHKEIFERQREPSRGSRDRKRPLNRSEGDQRKGRIERAVAGPVVFQNRPLVSFEYKGTKGGALF